VNNWIQTARPENLQDILWRLNNPWYWGLLAAAATIGAACLFLHLRRTVKAQGRLTALNYGHLTWLGAMVVAPFQGLNSGVLMVSYSLFMFGGAFMAVLVMTDWCHRRGSFLERCGTIWREVFHKKRNGAFVGD